MTRNTIQRALVLEAVTGLKNHATADEIYERVITVYPDIGKATVYRNLTKLASEGLIKKRIIPGRADRFDHNITNHYHIVCEKCDRLFDVDMEYMPDLPDKIIDKHGFIINSCDVYFTGVCKSCQE